MSEEQKVNLGLLSKSNYDVKKSSNVWVTIFTIVFKVASIAFYLVSSILGFNATFEIAVVTTLAACDFWYIKNISGRLMVGLRWSNVIGKY